MWTQERTTKLIEMWKKTPVLWDTKHKDYRNRDVRKNALEVLAIEFEMTSLDIEKKMTGLKNQFRREHNKVKTVGGNSSFSVEWFGYRPLMFLQDSLIIRDPMDMVALHLAPKLCLDSEDVYMHNDTVNFLELKEEKPEYSPHSMDGNKTDDDDVVYYPPVVESPPPPPANRKRKSSGLTVTQPHVLNIFSKPAQENFLRLSQESPNKLYENSQIKSPTLVPSPPQQDVKPSTSPAVVVRDEFAIYADYVANCLRKFRDQHSIIVAQNKINNILFDGAIGRYAFYGAPERDQTMPQSSSAGSGGGGGGGAVRPNHSAECSSTRKD